MSHLSCVASTLITCLHRRQHFSRQCQPACHLLKVFTPISFDRYASCHSRHFITPPTHVPFVSTAPSLTLLLCCPVWKFLTVSHVTVVCVWRKSLHGPLAYPFALLQAGRRTDLYNTVSAMDESKNSSRLDATALRWGIFLDPAAAVRPSSK